MKNTQDKPSFEEFIRMYGGTGWPITDLFTMPREYSLVVAADLDSRKCVGCCWENAKADYSATNVWKVPELTKERVDQLLSYSNLLEILLNLKQRDLRLNISKLAIPKIEYNRGGLHWRNVRNMLETFFKSTHNNIVVYNYKPRRKHLSKKMMGCYFLTGPSCVCKYEDVPAFWINGLKKRCWTYPR